MVPRNKVSPEVSPKIVKYLRTFNPLRPIYACVSTECTVARPTGQPAAQVHLHYHARKSESALFSFIAHIANSGWAMFAPVKPRNVEESI
jgi:hypothetical protein